MQLGDLAGQGSHLSVRLLDGEVAGGTGRQPDQAGQLGLLGGQPVLDLLPFPVEEGPVRPPGVHRLVAPVADLGLDLDAALLGDEPADALHCPQVLDHPRVGVTPQRGQQPAIGPGLGEEVELLTRLPQVAFDKALDHLTADAVELAAGAVWRPYLR